MAVNVHIAMTCSLSTSDPGSSFLPADQAYFASPPALLASLYFPQRLMGTSVLPVYSSREYGEAGVLTQLATEPPSPSCTSAICLAWS